MTSVIILEFETVLCLNNPSSSIRVNPNQINVEECNSNQPTNTAPHNHNRVTSLLKYSNLSEEEQKSENAKEIDNWIGEWFEDTFQKGFRSFKEQIGKPDFTSVDGLGGGRHKSDSNVKKVFHKEVCFPGNDKKLDYFSPPFYS